MAVVKSFSDYVNKINKKLLSHDGDGLITNIAGLNLNLTTVKAPTVENNWVNFWLDGMFVHGQNYTGDVLPRYPITDWVHRAKEP